MIEIRVRPVTRYIVTRYAEIDSPDDQGMVSAYCETIGEFDSEKHADRVAGAFYESEKAIDKAVSVEYSTGETAVNE